MKADYGGKEHNTVHHFVCIVYFFTELPARKRQKIQPSAEAESRGAESPGRRRMTPGVNTDVEDLEGGTWLWNTLAASICKNID